MTLTTPSEIGKIRRSGKPKRERRMGRRPF
jgi:hypothetical protein